VTAAPDFSLTTEKLEPFTRDDLLGQRTVLVFYPFAFSPVCTDQLNVYEEVQPDIAERGARLIAVSCDHIHAQRAFREHLGITIPQLSDWEPKGATSRAFHVYNAAGFSERALVLVDEEGEVAWRHVSPTLDEFPGANLIFDALAGAR
jgi:peroxiredoxin